MKIYSFILLLLTFIQVNAQSPLPKSNLPQSRLSPQQREMLQQMGINLNDPKSTSQQMKNSNFTNLFGATIPVKNAKRIALVNKKILNNPELTAYIDKLHSAIEKKLVGIDLDMMNQFSKDIQNQSTGKSSLASVASEAMINGDIDPAIWLMGKACQQNPTDPYNLNNYAAFLLMCGAQEYAIPILNRLNVDFPHNSTILNNLGQAWYGLGELDVANKYLDSAIIRYPGHSQACATKSTIEENKGNTSEAISLEKQSIQSGFSESKANSIENMGSELERGDFGNDIWLPEDPNWFSSVMNLRPSTYYYSVNERNEQLPKWSDFEIGCSQKLEGILNKLASLKIEGPPINKPDAKKNTPKTFTQPSYLCNKFKLKLNVLKKELNELDERVKRKSLPLTNLVLEKVNNVIMKSSEGISKEEACSLLKQFQDDMFELQKSFESNDREFVKQAAVLLKELIYVSKYAEDYEYGYTLDQLAYQGVFLNYVLGYSPGFATAPFDLNVAAVNSTANFWEGVPEVCPKKVPERKPIPKELPDYDIVSCRDKSVLGNKDALSITLECNIMTTEISDKYLPVHLKYKENWVKNQMIEVSGGVSVKVGGAGVSVGAGLDDKGNKSVTVGVGGNVGGVAVGGTAGVNVDENGNVTKTAGVTATVGIVTIGGKATIDKNGDLTSQAQVGIKAGNVSAQGNINSNLDVTGNVKVSGSSNIISNVTGPLQTNGSSSVEINIELDKNGISDIQTKGGVKGSANISGGDSNNVIGTQIGANTGISGTYVWNAGGDPTLSGTLSGLKFGGK